MIEETVEDMLLRSEHRRLVESYSGASSAIKLAEPSVLVEFARRYSLLGLEAQETLHEIMESPEADCDPRQVSLLEKKMSGINDAIDDSIRLWREAHS